MDHAHAQGATEGGRGVGGLAARALGVVGIALGLGLAVVVLGGHGRARARVESIEATIDAAIERGLARLGALHEGVRGIDSWVDGLGEALRAHVAGSEPVAQAREALLTKATVLSDRYLALRARYAEAREGLVAALERLDTLDRALPGVSIPSRPVEALAQLDREVRDVDERVLALLASASREQARFEGLAERVEGLRGRFGRVGTALETVQARIGALRVEVGDAADGAGRLLTFLAAALALACLYGAFLHLVLYRCARRRERPSTAAVAAP